MALSRKRSPYKTIYKERTIYKDPPSDPGHTSRPRIKAGIIIFWIFFSAFILGIFFLNWPRIHATVENALWPAWFKSRTKQDNPEGPSPGRDIPPQEPRSPMEDPPAPPAQEPPPRISRDLPEENPWEQQGDSPVFWQTPESMEQTNALDPPGVLSDPLLFSSGQPPPEAAPPPAAIPSGQVSRPAPAPEPVLRDRFLYFIQVDRGGTILRSQVTRAVPTSDAPLLEVMEVLLKGPTPEEQGQGLISLIPQGTKLLSLTVRMGTAYINMSEDFQYNIYGVEGYAAQLNQLIWTVTEFPNVKEVQILIEGRRVDYLGEGIWIGSPLSREML